MSLRQRATPPVDYEPGVAELDGDPVRRASGALGRGSVVVVRSAEGTGERLANLGSVAVTETPDPVLASVFVDPARRFQRFEGFGGAFTEAAATTFWKLPSELRADVLAAYFDEREGHGYRFCRTPINSCDFSLGPYAYSEVDRDVALEHFTIEHDRQAIVPMIKAARAVARNDLRLLASPWSPPAWMKTNGRMTLGGKLKPEYRRTWARYYCRYIKAYADEGIPIWGVSVQNEPEAAQPWESCLFTGEEERDFVRDYLGPALEYEGLSDVAIVIWDHNRDRMVERAYAVLSDPAAARYVWGTGFHWYGGDNFENVGVVHDAFPDKKLLLTEACQENGTHRASWALAERYAHSIINDLNRWTVGWIDWNLLLDASGGPNHAANYCSAPIIADTRRGILHYESSYAAIGHFSRFIRQGAQRVLCATTRDELEAVAFEHDGAVTTVVLNRSDLRIEFELRVGMHAARLESTPHSISTLCMTTAAPPQAYQILR